MSRLWVKLYVDFDDDPEIVRLNRYGKDARGLRDLLVGMWRYCKSEKTDGHVPAEIIGRLVYPDTPKNGRRDADRLVAVGLAERTEDGYHLPGFLKHNKSKAQITAESADKAKAGHAGGIASGVSRKAKQTASGNEAGSFEPASRARTQSTEDREQRTEDLTTKGGERTEPLRPADARCSAHRGIKDPPPCRGCMRERERAERDAERALERAEREREDLIRNCPDCHGTGWREDENGNPAGKCKHQRARRTA